MTNDAAIVVDRLTKRFGSLTALDAVSFEVAPATVLGLLGPNGAGKTTVVRVLATLLRPDGGHASVLGLDVTKDAGGVRRQIGLAGQYAAVDENLTGRENLRLIGRLAQLKRTDFCRRADELLERFDLTHSASRPVREYSGGMRRRLDVAAALVSEPAVLFLDEPTTGLDVGSRNSLWRTIRELVGTGTTVVLTTQYLEEADRLADRIAVIDNGRLIADDTPAALKSRLGATVLEVTMSDDAMAIRTAGVLDRLVGARVERQGSSVRVSSNDGSRLLLDAVHLLDGTSLVPDALQVRAPTLDDAFLQLTRPSTDELSAARIERAAS
jgi:daunorubicin resistance ABC transporter ATP-binding subunit